MFDTTKDLRRVIIDTQQREKLVNNYIYRRQHNKGDMQGWKASGILVTIGLISSIIIIIMLIAR
jgi:hypothetical protein